jgi:dTDP-4-amino-4,6-dideoxygalactose transaminase
VTAAGAPAEASSRPIGGFFERHHADEAAGSPSLLAAWTGGRPYSAFVNARSAFSALARTWPTASIWLPAFVCGDLLDRALAARTRFYPVLEGFRPDLAEIEAGVRPGDLVVFVAHFGLPLGSEARAFAARRPDLWIVEDRAQALDAGPPIPGAWLLFSPRKLLGVADGGLLVAPDAARSPPQPTAASDADALWRAPRLRAADPEGRDNAAWHAANQAKEAAMGGGDQAMTAESLAILAEVSLDRLAARRRANWDVLDHGLRAWSALPADPGAPPLGYVLRLEPEARDRLLAGLHAHRVFAAVHWPRIAAPAEAFPREAGWTRELVTLPCDHRYDAAAMARIAELANDLLR